MSNSIKDLSNQACVALGMKLTRFRDTEANLLKLIFVCVRKLHANLAREQTGAFHLLRRRRVGEVELLVLQKVDAVLGLNMRVDDGRKPGYLLAADAALVGDDIERVIGFGVNVFGGQGTLLEGQRATCALYRRDERPFDIGNDLGFITLGVNALSLVAGLGVCPEDLDDLGNWAAPLQNLT